MPYMNTVNFDFLAYLEQVQTMTNFFSTGRNVVEDADESPPDRQLPFPITVPLSPAPVTIPFPQSTFPEQLLSHIFSFLNPSHSPDGSTLASCARTCKQWTALAEARLYRSVLVRSERSLFDVWDRLASTPHLASLVREIRMSEDDDAPEWGERFARKRKEPFPTWFLQTPARLAPVAPQTEALTFENINWRAFRLRDGPTSARWLSQWRLFPPLRELCLTFCDFTSFHEFELLMMALPNISALHLDVVSWGSHTVAMADTMRPDPRRQRIALSSLRIGHACDLHTIAMWILATSSMRTLAKIELPNACEGAPEVITPFLSETAGTVEYVRIGCSGMRNSLGAVLKDHMNFYVWPHLRTLHLSLYDLRPEKINWVPMLLSRALPASAREHGMCPTGLCTPSILCPMCQLPPSNVTTIVFDVALYYSAQLDNVVWDQIVWVLQRLFAGGVGIQHIVVNQRGELGRVGAELALKRRLGSLHSLVELKMD